MEWTDKPSGPGFFWVWQPKDEWPCKGEMHVVRVDHYERRGLVAWPPGMDFDVPVDGETWEQARWLGPIEPPAPPSN